VGEELLLSARPQAHPEAPVPVLPGRRPADGYQRQWERPTGLVEGAEDSPPILAAQVAPYCGLEDDRQRTGQALGEQVGKTLHDVTALDCGWIAAQRLDRGGKTGGGWGLCVP